MKYAQGEPGRFAGGVGGTVDFARMWSLLDAVRLIETEPAATSRWTQADRTAFRRWIAELLEWWLGSADGKKARLIKNNIGTAFDITAMAMATYVGNATAAADLVNNDARGRVDLQISANGTLPMEDGRSSSFGYHTGDLEGFLKLAAVVNASARLARSAGVPIEESAADLLRYSNPESGGSIHKALSWLAPICKANATNWPFPMTNNSGESVETYLPRCRLIFNWAGLLFTPAEGGSDFAAVARGSSTAKDAYTTNALSTLDYTRLLFSE